MADNDADTVTDHESPEWTEAGFASARPFQEVFPNQFASWTRVGRPPVLQPKLPIGFRLFPGGRVRHPGRFMKIQKF